MPKIIALCGKICSGKTFYANKIKERENAVILSTDEVTFYLMDNEQGERYDDFAKRVNEYLMKKAIDIVRAGVKSTLSYLKKMRIGVNFLKKRQVFHFSAIKEKTQPAGLTRRKKI